jgi:hypothetical protein
MKRVFYGPQGPASNRNRWVDAALQQVERWINTLEAFRGATTSRDGSDGLVPQPMAGEQSYALFGDGKYHPVSGGGGGGAVGSPGEIQISDGAGNPISDSDFKYDPSTDTLYAKHISAQDATVNGEVYGPGWDGDNTVPTKNDVYDKIESMGAIVPPPVFFTPWPINVTSSVVGPPTGDNVYTIISGIVVASTSKLVWIMAQIAGSGTIKKKLAKPVTWNFELQLKNVATGAWTLLGTAAFTVKANGIANKFNLNVSTFRPAVSAATYDLILVSKRGSKPMSTGAVTVNVMGQIP